MTGGGRPWALPICRSSWTCRSCHWWHVGGIMWSRDISFCWRWQRFTQCQLKLWLMIWEIPRERKRSQFPQWTCSQWKHAHTWLGICKVLRSWWVYIDEGNRRKPVLTWCWSAIPNASYIGSIGDCGLRLRSDHVLVRILIKSSYESYLTDNSITYYVPFFFSRI